MRRLRRPREPGGLPELRRLRTEHEHAARLSAADARSPDFAWPPRNLRRYRELRRRALYIRGGRDLLKAHHIHGDHGVDSAVRRGARRRRRREGTKGRRNGKRK